MYVLNKKAFVVACCLAGFSTAWAKDSTERAGDILQVAVPAIALGMSFYNDDKEGQLQFYKSFLVNIGATQVLKNTIDAKRPNGGEQSFPSGHTSAAFQGAAFIHARYGLSSALPAYAAATLVGYSRVESNKHHTRDVIAGAALGTAASFYFTREPFNPKSALLTPFIDGKHVGLAWTRTLD